MTNPQSDPGDENDFKGQISMIKEITKEQYEAYKDEPDYYEGLAGIYKLLPPFSQIMLIGNPGEGLYVVEYQVLVEG